METLSQYGYLISNLLGLPGVALALWFAGRHRPSVLAAGMIEALHSVPLVWFNGVYWNPARVGGWGDWGIEDILVSFSLGVGVWFAAILPVHSRLLCRIEFGRTVFRTILIALPTTVMAFAVWRAGAGVMETLLIVMAATTVVLGLLRPDLYRYSAQAVVLYPPYYVFVLYLTALFVPEFFGIWDGPELWGLRLFGLPLEELAFVVMFSTCYPMIMGTVFDVQLLGKSSDNRKMMS